MLTAEYLGLSEGDQTMLYIVSGKVVQPNRWFVVAACLRHALPRGGNEFFRIAIDPSGDLFVRVFNDNAAASINNKTFCNTRPKGAMETVHFSPVRKIELYRENDDEALKQEFELVI